MRLGLLLVSLSIGLPFGSRFRRSLLISELLGCFLCGEAGLIRPPSLPGGGHSVNAIVERLVQNLDLRRTHKLPFLKGDDGSTDFFRGRGGRRGVGHFTRGRGHLVARVTKLAFGRREGLFEGEALLCGE